MPDTGGPSHHCGIFNIGMIFDNAAQHRLFLSCRKFWSYKSRSKLQGARPSTILASSLLCLYQVQSRRSPIPNRRLPTVQREWRVGLRVSQALAAFVKWYLNQPQGQR
jgi:hypothetical protein